MVFALALAAGIWWWIGQSKMGYTFHAVICQPIVMALPFGIIAGDVGTAMKIGANVEMVYLGMVAAGANIPADECLAGCISIPIALLTGMDPAAAVTLAVPFGLLGVFQDQIRRTLQAVFAHKADAYAEQGNVKGIERCAVAYPLALGIFIEIPDCICGYLSGSRCCREVIGCDSGMAYTRIVSYWINTPCIRICNYDFYYWQKYLSSIFYYWIFLRFSIWELAQWQLQSLEHV